MEPSYDNYETLEKELESEPVCKPPVTAAVVQKKESQLMKAVDKASHSKNSSSIISSKSLRAFIMATHQVSDNASDLPLQV